MENNYLKKKLEKNQVPHETFFEISMEEISPWNNIKGPTCRSYCRGSQEEQQKKIEVLPYNRFNEEKIWFSTYVYC